MFEKKLLPPTFPQSVGDIIDESLLNQLELVIKVDRYESAHMNDSIMVHLSEHIASPPFLITFDNLQYPYYELIIPFSRIPFGSYNVYYTVLDWTGQKTQSKSNYITIKKSDINSLIGAELILVGYQPIGDEYGILTIKVNDSNTAIPVKNTQVFYSLEQAVNLHHVSIIGTNSDTKNSSATDDYGQFRINLKGQPGESCTIGMIAGQYIGNIDYTMGKL
jgi:hypothetical protein